METELKFKTIEAERNAETVRITIKAADEYAAMMLYDTITANLSMGLLDLTVMVDAPSGRK